MREEVVLNLVEEVGFSQNLANGIATPRPWRVAVLEVIQAAYEGGHLEGLLKWALIEGVNVGSHWRAGWPKGLKVPESFRGSGRWLARDQGGHYRLLQENLVQAYAKALNSRVSPAVQAQTLLAILGWGPIHAIDDLAELTRQVIKLTILELRKELEKYEAAQRAAAADAVLYEGRVGCTHFVVVREDAPGDRYYPDRFVVRVGKAYDERVRLDQVEPHFDGLRAVGLDWERTFCSQCGVDDPDCGKSCTAPWRVVWA